MKAPQSAKKFLSMVLVVCIMCICCSLLAPNTTLAGTLDAYIDAEAASVNAGNDVTDNGLTYWGYEQGTYLAPAITTAQKRAGSNSIKYEIASDSSTNGVPYDRDRIENYVELNRSDYPGLNHNIWQTTKYLGLSVYIPSDFITPSDWFVFYQIKQHDGSINPSPNIALEVDTSGNVRVALRHGTGNQDSSTVTTFTNIGTLASFKGKWVDFVIKFKITTGSDGIAQVWKKLSTETTYTNVVNYSGMTGFTACSTTSFEIKGGIYRAVMPINHKLYLDEIRYGNAINDVKFPGTTINEGGTGTYSFQAAAASSQSGFSPWAVVNDAGAPSGKYIHAPGLNSTVSAPATGQAVYNFYRPTAGNATLSATILAPDLASDSFWYKIDNGSWVVWYAPSVSSNWQTLTKTITGLSSGNHTVTIAYREGNMKLDSLGIN
ncbi:heparin lyase I family protein [Paenibacillus qinlingensis]|uniref:heparin lyase I family protein n=1 Tax=Paenibacillus qinlingensis TaxID=1837343 RepID=UPI001563AD3E|nr:heparin lyase I family protein [Paenibacillus qinlingensis]NQX58654.1 heparin lyase I family protein [Paenibacillus qinlingensis]